ncbi:TPA: metallophosphoesterase [candidate division CPR2 bacterium]|uniref:Metallophosphoesterase n=1 Tax=candidate division CPR2 bacterium GW2011_GWC1_41_48 TaxID=1618344 RepID=A0A0G0W9K3_UNCC2|nr:MAG: Metallophosphoesterase [candidate division CPR2 bacterium GW2011_GWC2_39_35]KKR29475.1 MAG: Metallophosphoesterase [candidate division CPR2 bacterium GW2011_GWD2_39_7]KKR29700.1 MAG: Metallophosphoesterase [candidate division CPR2 bacterium GW2011_GWD1_39_7]KKS09630.1 MAG: Metallophosphoesterase [candidate division CPR2 bacterium GW2011_GWC1_41_48]OGB59485.1 MAG: hypothetical protein A2Y27_00835 [candidate division CPR2 bacterium GWD1_39_7]OGB71703.1 MAG: hypothetical protein A2Y26_037
MARIAVVADLHVHEQSKGYIKKLFLRRDINKEADILLIGGDLTQNGKIREAEILLEELKVVKIPIYAVLGNHDYQLNKKDKIIEVLKDKVLVLDGDGIDIEIKGFKVGIAGVKGFCGGFEPHVAQAYGEKALKDFVFAGDREAEKLDEALSELESDVKIALLHYSPVKETIIGEFPEIFAFLGSKKLSVPLDYHKVSIAFHGHAHHGTIIGKTDGGIEVHNATRILYHNNYIVFELKEGKWIRKF